MLDHHLFWKALHFLQEQVYSIEVLLYPYTPGLLGGNCSQGQFSSSTAAAPGVAGPNHGGPYLQWYMGLFLKTVWKLLLVPKVAVCQAQFKMLLYLKHSAVWDQDTFHTIHSATAIFRWDCTSNISFNNRRMMVKSRAFTVMAPELWNSLPKELETIPSLEAFQTRLKNT